MTTIKIIKPGNKVIIIDSCDYLFLTRTWTIDSTGYPSIGISNKGKKTRLRMHKIIMFDAGLSVDHINGNKLDNRRSNLRYVTQQENTFNQAPGKRNKSGYKGVCWCKTKKKFKAYIVKNGHHNHLGYFILKTEAAKAYNNAAIKYFGKYARLNHVKEVSLCQTQGKVAVDGDL